MENVGNQNKLEIEKSTQSEKVGNPKKYNIRKSRKSEKKDIGKSKKSENEGNLGKVENLKNRN